MNEKVIIIGGGLAGLTSAIHLSGAGYPVTLFEKNTFPRHKVCGEYISNEVLPYFEFLGIDITSLNPVNIARASVSTVSGKQTGCDLPLGGFGISRYALDDLLYEKAKTLGCEVIHESVTGIDFTGDGFSVVVGDTAYTTKIVIGAFGKRSNIDQKLRRDFIGRKSPWLAVKAHYSGDFPENVVGLHNFRGGYCGVSKVENGAINICYLADFESFKKYKDIEEYQRHVVTQNPHLKAIFSNSKELFRPIAISQISFEDKLPVENHILMTGDTAGLIHPLCGNGMAMAIHSAKIASELVIGFLSGGMSRKTLEKKYAVAWNRNFRKRIRSGKLLAALLRNERLAAFVMGLIVIFPSLLPAIIRRTHGKPLMAT